MERLQKEQDFIQHCLNHVYRIESWKERQREKDNQIKEIKEQRFLKFQEKYTCHKPAYGGARIVAPDGMVLCVCDTKKAQWYLNNNLAETISEEPLVIRLKFVPSGLS